MEIIVNKKIVNEQHTLYLQKVRGGSLVSTADKWDLYVTDSAVPLDGGETKEDGSQVYVDEHGTDVFDADSKFLKAFDVEIPLACFGKTPAECRNKREDFFKYLLNDGTLHKVYMPFFEMGRTKVTYKSVSDIRFQRGNDCCVLSFKIKVMVNDPVSTVKLSSEGGSRNLVLSKDEDKS